MCGAASGGRFFGHWIDSFDNLVGVEFLGHWALYSPSVTKDVATKPFITVVKIRFIVIVVVCLLACLSVCLSACLPAWRCDVVTMIDMFVVGSSVVLFFL